MRADAATFVPGAYSHGQASNHRHPRPVTNSFVSEDGVIDTRSSNSSGSHFGLGELKKSPLLLVCVRKASGEAVFGPEELDANCKICDLRSKVRAANPVDLSTTVELVSGGQTLKAEDTLGTLLHPELKGALELTVVYVTRPTPSGHFTFCHQIWSGIHCYYTLVLDDDGSATWTEKVETYPDNCGVNIHEQNFGPSYEIRERVGSICWLDNGDLQVNLDDSTRTIPKSSRVSFTDGRMFFHDAKLSRIQGGSENLVLKA